MFKKLIKALNNYLGYRHNIPKPIDDSIMGHIGFCMGEYDQETCDDCPTMDDCLDLAKQEREEHHGLG